MIILGAVGLSADLARITIGPLGPVLDAVAASGQRVAALVAANPLPAVAVVASAALVLGVLYAVLLQRTRTVRSELVSRSLAEARAEREGSLR